MEDVVADSALAFGLNSGTVMALGVGSVMGALALLSLQAFQNWLGAPRAHANHCKTKTLDRCCRCAYGAPAHAGSLRKKQEDKVEVEQAIIFHMSQNENVGEKASLAESQLKSSNCCVSCFAPLLSALTSAARLRARREVTQSAPLHGSALFAVDPQLPSPPSKATCASCVAPTKLGNQEGIDSGAPTSVEGLSLVDSQLEVKLQDRLSDLLQATWPEPHSPQAAAQRLVAALGTRVCMARFLHARQGSLDLAEEMFRDVAIWRAAHADRVFKDESMLADWDEIGPYWLGVTCLAPSPLDGPTPVLYCRAAYLLPLFQHFSEEKLSSSYTRFMECSLEAQLEARAQRLRLGFPKASDELGPPRMVDVYDLHGVGFAHLRCLTGIKFLARVLGIGQKYYPEHLDRAFVLGAPWFFEVGWAILRRALHANTVAKIVITSEATHPDLLELLGEDAVKELQRSVKPFPIGDGDPAALRPTAANIGRCSPLLPLNARV